MQKHLKRIEDEIQSNPFIGLPQNLYDPLNYMMGLGGKRIRPLLTLLGCEMFSGTIEKAMPAALAIEVFHNFSLIHDDIMDNAPLRRGQASVFKKWNPNLAILSGDLMLVKAYELLAESNPKNLNKLLKAFTTAAAQVCEGQQLDMNFETQTDVLESEYLEMIRLKTSVLLGCSLKLGAIIAIAPEEELEKIYALGVNMGMGFQLMDDYLDAFGTADLVGKQPGGDILANKKTLMVIKAMETDKERLTGLFDNKELGDLEKIDKVKEVFLKTGAHDYLKSLSEKYYAMAFKNLQEIKVEESKKTDLSEMLIYLQNRTY